MAIKKTELNPPFFALQTYGWTHYFTSLDVSYAYTCIETCKHVEYANNV